MPTAAITVALVAIFILANAIRILREYERGVVFRLGRLIGAKGPGLILLIPMVDKMLRVDLRTVTFDVPPQDVITRDNVTIKVNAVVYFRVMDANKAIVSVENYLMATSQIAQTTLRSILGQFELDDLLANRDQINQQWDVIGGNGMTARTKDIQGVAIAEEDCRLRFAHHQLRADAIGTLPHFREAMHNLIAHFIRIFD